MSCASNFSTATCGANGCSPCTAPPNGLATCDGTSCGFDCDSDFHKNLGGTACDADTSVASCGVAASDCNTEKPANSVATCNGATCGFECLGSYCKVGDSCADTQTDPENCGECGKRCASGSCVSGQCQGVPASCRQIKLLDDAATDGRYVIDPDGPDGAAPFTAYCDMTRDRGGWTLWARVYGAQAQLDNAGQMGTLTSPEQTTTAKLPDSAVNLLKGTGGGKAFRVNFTDQKPAARNFYWSAGCTFSGATQMATYLSSPACGWYYTAFERSTLRDDRYVTGGATGLSAHSSSWGTTPYAAEDAAHFIWAYPATTPGHYLSPGDYRGTLATWWARAPDSWTMPDSRTQYCRATDNCSTASPSGQDGTYVINRPAYVVQDAATPEHVTDLVTGLMWQRVVPPGAESWEVARDACEALVLDGYSDWRLPTRLELVSLVDFGLYDPAIDATSKWTTPVYFPSPPAEAHWTSSPAASGGRWTVEFQRGALDTSTGTARRRCVRGAAPAARALAITTNTVLDHSTGLMWQRASTSGGWDSALSTCEASSADGFTDWRLPTIKELLTLVDEGRSAPAVDPAFGDTGSAAVYLSSSPSRRQADSVWGVDFQFGKTGDGYHYQTARPARCVR